MILPIVAYGAPVLRKKAAAIDKDYKGLDALIENMYETMYHAQGVGLAAPQVGKPVRIFVIDADPFSEDEAQLEGFKKVFINPEMIEEEGEEWAFSEGCLSIPEVREDVSRKPKIKLRYQDENFETHEEEFDGLAARVIQHEYDHLEGVLFTDLIPAIRKTMIKGKLNQIAKGKIKSDYPMSFYDNKRKR